MIRFLFISLIVSSLIASIHSSTAMIQSIGSIDPASVFAMTDLTRAYMLSHPTHYINVQLAGSDKATVESLVRREADFGIITTSILPNIAVANPSIYMIPFLLNALVPIYRLDALGANSVSLIIPREILPRIYSGNITRFDHPDLVEANPSLELPAKNITVVLYETDTVQQQHLKEMLHQLDPSVDVTAGFPTEKYASFTMMYSGDKAVAAQVATVDGTFAVTYFSTADNLSCAVARMTNKARKVVQVSATSMNLAASELGTAIPESRTMIAPLTDATNNAAWPLTLTSYMIIDIDHARNTCKAKRFLVEFLLFFYQSPVVAALFSQTSYAAIPDIILQRSGAIDLLTKKIVCRGSVALPPLETKVRHFGIADQWMVAARMLSGLYRGVETNVVFDPVLADSTDLVVQQIMESELDIAFVGEDYLDPRLWKQFQDSDDFLILPMFVTGVDFFVNAFLTATLTVMALNPTYQPFRVDPEFAVLLETGCLDNFNHPKMAELNPWVGAAMSAGNISLQIQQINSCVGNVRYAEKFSEWARTELKYQWPTLSPESQAQLEFCMSARNPKLPKLADLLRNCASDPEMGVYYVRDERMIPNLVSGRIAGVSSGQADFDPSRLFPDLPTYRNDKLHWAGPTYANMLACAHDTFEPIKLTYSFINTNNVNCFALSQQTMMIVRKKYYSSPTVTNASSCVRGRDTLGLAQWMVTSESFAGLTMANNMGRLSTATPISQAVYLNALNDIMCDDEPLMVTLPINWYLSQGLVGLGYAAASIGIFLTLACAAFIVIYHRHPTIRASSPVLVLTSLVGVLVLFTSLIALVMPVTNESCAAVAWTINLGVMITFVPLFAKTWRIYKIFGRRKLSVVKLSNRKLLLMCGVLLIAECIIMTVFQAVSPFQSVFTEVMEGSPPRAHHYLQCGAQNEGVDIFVAIVFEKGLLFVVGALLAFSTRGVSSTFNDSSQIGVTIYMFVFTIALIAIIILVTEAIGNVMVALIQVAVIWLSFFTMTMLIVPKALVVFGKTGNGQGSLAGPSPDSSSAFSFISLDALDSLPMIGSYVSALRNHLRQVEAKQVTMKHKRENAGDGKVYNQTANHSVNQSLNNINTSMIQPISCAISPRNQTQDALTNRFLIERVVSPNSGSVLTKRPNRATLDTNPASSQPTRQLNPTASQSGNQTDTHQLIEAQRSSSYHISVPPLKSVADVQITHEAAVDL